MQMLRSVLLAGTTVFNFSALAFIQLDQAVSISFTVPLLVALLAGPIIGEWVSRKNLIAIFVGFSGVLLVTKPGFGEFHFAYLLALANAVCMAFYSIATRFVTAYDSARTSIAVTSLAEPSACSWLRATPPAPSKKMAESFSPAARARLAASTSSHAGDLGARSVTQSGEPGMPGTQPAPGPQPVDGELPTSQSTEDTPTKRAHTEEEQQ